MVILKQLLFFRWILKPALVFERLGIGFEVYQIAGVLLQGENLRDSRLTPLTGRFLRFLAALADSFACPIVSGR